MDGGFRNGAHTSHDQGSRPNGVHGGGVFVKTEPALDKSKDLSLSGGDAAMVNGSHGAARDSSNEAPTQKFQAGAPPAPNPLRMDDLPDEIQHITTGIMPLSLLLMRLAQISHNHLQELVAELATRPIAPSTGAVGGGSSSPDYRSTNTEDASPDSLEKKKMILHFIQDLHAKWVKALVITEWSRKAELVGKLIDLKAHIEQQLYHYTAVMWEMANVKRDLVFARLPSPDLKTALEVLSSGEVSWLPEFGYIEPPPVTPQQQLEWMDNLNTMLSVRLSLDDYDKIPQPFKSYSISSGRVTFRVDGEFEVDLTIADEDFEKQFWFIDFRFLFSPAPADLSDALRTFLEAKVNDALGADGLAGCYHFLHEFVLTHKITEFTRQAVELSHGRWTETLKVERLNRALAIQYWVGRPGPALKSWIILGINSGRGSGQNSSCLALRWFRDGKEAKDVAISLDACDISAEALLTSTISRHIEHVLSAMHARLLSFPRFRNREASLKLEISREEPMLSRLSMQLSRGEQLTVRMNPTTGSFSLSPHVRTVISGEHNLNATQKNPADEGFVVLEKTRCFYATEELTRRGKSAGWVVGPSPVKVDELKAHMKTRDPFHSVWLRRRDWCPEWFVLVTMSLGGDRWWLVEVPGTGAPVRRIRTFSKVMLASSQPDLSEAFFDSLTVFVTAMISQLADLRELHRRRIRHTIQDAPSMALSRDIKTPAVFVRLSELVPQVAAQRGSNKRPWAHDFVQVVFRGVQRRRAGRGAGSGLDVVLEATVAVTDKTKFGLLRGNVARDVSFNARLGQFSLRLQVEAGTAVVDALAGRLQAIARLVDFVDAMRRGGKDTACESVTLREVVFTYGGSHDEEDATGRRWRVWLDLATGPRVDVKLEKTNPHLRILDRLKELASSADLKVLPSLLNLTLPLLRAAEAMETAWEPVAMRDQGSVEIFHVALDCLTIRYRLAGRPNQPRRQLKLRLDMKVRRGERWWHLWPENRGNQQGETEFSRALKPVWEGRGANGADWRGLGLSAAARPATGIEPLLLAVDKAVLALVGTLPPPARPQGVAAAMASRNSLADPSTSSPMMAKRFSQSSGGPGSQPRSSQTMSQAGAQNNNHNRTVGKGSSSVVVID